MSTVELSEEDKARMDAEMGRLIKVLKASGLSPGPELAGMLVCLAASFYVMEGFDVDDFTEITTGAMKAALKATADWEPKKQQALLLLRLMRSTPVPGTEEAREKGCSCPSEESAREVLGPPPKGAVKQFAMDPGCKVHGELVMQMATSSGIAGSA